MDPARPLHRDHHDVVDVTDLAVAARERALSTIADALAEASVPEGREVFIAVFHIDGDQARFAWQAHRRLCRTPEQLLDEIASVLPAPPERAAVMVDNRIIEVG